MYSYYRELKRKILAGFNGDCKYIGLAVRYHYRDIDIEKGKKKLLG